MRVLLLDTSVGRPFFAYSADFYDISFLKELPDKEGLDSLGDFVRGLDYPPEMIGVCKGPGRFSSLRQGVAYGLGIAHSLRIPILGWSTTEAFVPRENGVFTVCIAVSKREGFICLRELVDGEVRTLVEPKVVGVKEIFDFCKGYGSRKILCPNKGFFENIPDDITVDVVVPNFSRVLSLLKSQWERGAAENSLELDYSGPSPF
ncbi:hypothetical protein [Chlamydiifrater volucris]|uniref:hypothetical protein n=1 Tax=Chlamydiifrater volucris TaxID=2681470 RepID=UPI001BCD5169|nr:hypothetical protein [Chlamydiifrater volucris]